MDKNQQTVFSILMMRFGLDPYKSIPLTNQWFREHPEKHWEDLRQSLLNGEVIFNQDRLYDVNLPEIKALTRKMRGHRYTALKADAPYLRCPQICRAHQADGACSGVPR